MPIRLPRSSTNHRLPSLPVTIWAGPEPCGRLNSASAPVERAADPIAGMLCEPQIAIGSGGDAGRTAIVPGELQVCDALVVVHTPDAISGGVGEPDRAIGAGDDPFRKSARIDLVARNRSGGRDSPYPVALVLGVPDVAVGTRGYRVRRVSAYRLMMRDGSGRSRRRGRGGLLRCSSASREHQRERKSDQIFTK